MVSTRSAAVTPSAPSASSRKRTAPSQAQRNATRAKRAKLQSDVSDASSDEEEDSAGTSEDSAVEKENVVQPRTPRGKRTVSRAGGAADELPSGGKRKRTVSAPKPVAECDLKTPTKARAQSSPRKPNHAKADTTPSKKTRRQSLANATNRRVVISEDEYNSGSSSSDGDDSNSDNDESDSARPTRAKAAGSSKRVGKVDTPDTSLEAAADVDTEPECDAQDAKIKTPFGRARALLRAPLDSDASLVGRDTERRELVAYLRGNTLKSLYVSGGPGTGKTALTREVLASFDKTQQKRVDEDGDELEEWARELPARKVYVNCVGRREEAVWDTILAALDEHDDDADDTPRGRSPVKSKTKSPRKRTVTASPTKARTGKRDGKKEFERWLAREGGRCILVLDEIDHLSASSGVLAGVFALPSQLNDESSSDSALRVVAISNSHTLGTRSAHVSTLHFAPYDKDQMAAIARGRLAPLASSTPDAKPLVPAPVVSFAAAKVAAVTGDVRALVALLVRTMDVAERRCTKTNATVLAAGPPDVLEALKSVQLVAAARPSRPTPTTSASAPSIMTTASKTRAGPTAGLALQPKLALLCLMLAKRRISSGLSLGIMGVGIVQVDPFGNFSTPKKNKAASPFKNPSPVKSSPSKSSNNNNATLDAGTLHAFYTHALGRSSAIVGVSRTEFSDVLSVLEACGATCTPSSSSSSFSPTKGLGRSASFSGAMFGGAARALDVPECVRPEDLWVDGGVEGDLVRGLWEKEGRVIEREMPKPVAAKAEVEGMEVDE